jgi:hypothetical protein
MVHLNKCLKSFLQERQRSEDFKNLRLGDSKETNSRRDFEPQKEQQRTGFAGFGLNEISLRKLKKGHMFHLLIMAGFDLHSEHKKTG